MVRAVAMDVCALCELAFPTTTRSDGSTAAATAAAALGVTLDGSALPSHSSISLGGLNIGDGLLAASAARTLADITASAMLQPCGGGGASVAASTDARLHLLRAVLTHPTDEARVAAARSLKAALKHTPTRLALPPCRPLRDLLFARVHAEAHPDAARYVAHATFLLLRRTPEELGVDAIVVPAAAAPADAPPPAAVAEWARLLCAFDASRDSDARAHHIRIGAELLRPLVRGVARLSPLEGGDGHADAWIVGGVDVAAVASAWADRAAAGLASMRTPRLRLAAARALSSSQLLSAYIALVEEGEEAENAGVKGGADVAGVPAGGHAGASRTSARRQQLLRGGAACWRAAIAALSDYDDEVRDAARASVAQALAALVAPGGRAAARATATREALWACVDASEAADNGAATTSTAAAGGAPAVVPPHPLPCPRLRDTVVAALADIDAGHTTPAISDAGALRLAYAMLGGLAAGAVLTVATLRDIAAEAAARLARLPHPPPPPAPGAPPLPAPDFLRRTLFVPDAENDFEEPAETAALAAGALALARRMREQRGGRASDGDAAAADALSEAAAVAVAGSAYVEASGGGGGAAIAEQGAWFF